jgi:hypothetical protein
LKEKERKKRGKNVLVFGRSENPHSSSFAFGFLKSD